MPFVIRHGAATQAAMAREQGRLQAEALRAEADAELYRSMAGTAIDVVNRYFSRRDQERQRSWEQEQAAAERDWKAGESAADRASREKIAGENIGGRLKVVETQQEGMNKRLEIAETGRSERAKVTEAGRADRAAENFGILRQRLDLDSRRVGQQDRSLDLREQERRDAQKKETEDAETRVELAASTAEALEAAYKAAGRPLDGWFDAAVALIEKGRAVPPWIASRLPVGQEQRATMERPSETAQAYRTLATFAPAQAWAAASERVKGPDGQATGIPTRQAAIAYNELIRAARDPLTTTADLERMYSELKLVLLSSPEAPPALGEVVSIIESRIGPQPMPAAGGAQQGGGFWGTVGSALGGLSPMRMGARVGARLGSALGGGQSPTPAPAPAAPGGADAKLDAILDSMSPEEIKALLAGE